MWDKILEKFYSFIGAINLKQRLIILIILATVIPVFIISYMIFMYSTNIIKEEILVSARNTIGQVSKNLDELISGQVLNVSNMLMYDKRIYERLTQRGIPDANGTREKEADEVLLNREILAQYLSVNDKIKLAALYGRNDVLYNISLPATEENLILPEIRKMAKISRKQNLIVQWYPLQENFFTTGKTNDQRQDYVTIASRGIFNPETSEYLGTQLYTICERAIYEKYKDVRLGKTGEIFVIDKSGNLVSSSNEKNFANISVDRELVKKIISNNGDMFTIRKNNRDTLIIVQKSKVVPWITVGIVPAFEMADKVNNLVVKIIVVLVVALSISLILVVIISNGIVKPIRKIVSSMEEVEKGNLNVSVDIKGEYEVSNLGRYFNGMIDRINKLIQEEYELEKKKKEAELNVLMAQINPHFLYNTLESIVWKARSVKAYEISEMASSLGRFFRIAVNRGSVIVSVKEEIEHVKAYITIQKIRYGNRFDCVISVADERLYQYKTLKLLLQPIVENSLSYGLEPDKEGGTVTIKILEQDQKLLFEVSDNGVGIPKDKLREIESKLSGEIPEDQQGIKVHERRGIGLRNINDRIKLYFGNDYGIKIESQEEEGTLVRIILPVVE